MQYAMRWNVSQWFPKTAEIAPILVPAPSIDARLVKKWDSQAGALRSSPALSMVFKIGDKIWSMSKYLPTLWNHTIHIILWITQIYCDFFSYVLLYKKIIEKVIQRPKKLSMWKRVKSSWYFHKTCQLGTLRKLDCFLGTQCSYL